MTCSHKKQKCNLTPPHHHDCHRSRSHQCRLSGAPQFRTLDDEGSSSSDWMSSSIQSDEEDHSFQRFPGLGLGVQSSSLSSLLLFLEALAPEEEEVGSSMLLEDSGDDGPTSSPSLYSSAPRGTVMWPSSSSEELMAKKSSSSSEELKAREPSLSDEEQKTEKPSSSDEETGEGVFTFVRRAESRDVLVFIRRGGALVFIPRDEVGGHHPLRQKRRSRLHPKRRSRGHHHLRQKRRSPRLHLERLKSGSPSSPSEAMEPSSSTTGMKKRAYRSRMSTVKVLKGKFSSNIQF
ncbi:hypothetical protein GBF38_000647 [Nibea albiflora]|nr:hypothetical protein GBF38_000647 [Nibea albiflora]